MSLELVAKHFPQFSENQLHQYRSFVDTLLDVNGRINLISRKDTDEVWIRHILHSLSIVKVISFQPGMSVADVGTGGGLPGIPLAIAFPETQFVLIDSIGKKIAAVREMVDKLGLKNVKALNARMENVPDRFDFVTSRAVSALPTMVGWLHGKVKRGNSCELPNGLLYIKGGDFQNELDEIAKPAKMWELSGWYVDEFFETKKLIWLDIAS
ncbi:MAG: 16S rRNA (guanine(527)-N(7))-methyltransferase RsmG [Flavobacteriales bacterium]